MDDPLRDFNDMKLEIWSAVLILVVMDDPLRAPVRPFYYKHSGLNPCCNG